MIERAAGEQGEEDRDAQLVLRLGFDLALGVEGQTGHGIGADKGGLDVLWRTIRQLELTKVEAEDAGPTEAASRPSLGDGADERGALGDGDAAVGAEDGFGDNGVNRLAGGGDFGAEWLVEVGFEDPSAGVVVGGGRGSGGLLPEVALGRRSGGKDGWRRGLRGKGDGRGGGGRPGGALFNALGVVGEAGVDELLEAVSLARGDVDGDVAAHNGDARVPLAADEASFDGRRGDGAVDRRTVGGGGGLDGDVDAVGEDEAGEADDGDVKGGEVPAEASAGTPLLVGTQRNDGAVEHGVFR